MKYIESPGMDPYFNLALEEHLMLRCRPGERILYLWQNDRTVVIGRNQDPWSECPVDLLEREGVKLARRKSGGGAVYHDRGNLNYTFIAHERDSNVVRQLLAVVKALGAVGINAEVSGRNDILAAGRKISGNAFYKSGGVCCHHGTLMVNVDLGAVERYLTPGRDKLSAKSVDSVKSRVVNLREFVGNVSVDKLREELKAAYMQVCNDKAEELCVSSMDLEEIRQRASRFSDRSWIYGDMRRYDLEISRRFAWGGVTVSADVDHGKIAAVKVRSDAMDPELPGKLEAALTGAELTGLADAVRCGVEVETREEIAQWLSETPSGG